MSKNENTNSFRGRRKLSLTKKAGHIKLSKVDGALFKEVQENGPMLLWIGEDFPRDECRFRGLELRKNPLSKWLGFKECKL